MGKYHIVIIVALFASSVLACTNVSKPLKENEEKTGCVMEDTLGQECVVNSLTAETFKKKVMDYEKHSQWNFIGERPAIVDFYAPWCGPCKNTAPVLELLAKKYQAQLDIYKVNIDQEPELAQVFGISSIPALLFIPVEGLPTLQVGAMQMSEIEKLIKSVLLHNKSL